MGSRVSIFGADTIDCLPWPANEQSLYAQKYLVPLIKDNPLSYIDNANVQMKALSLDSLVMPLLISEERPGNSDVCSPYSHYIRYTLSEMARRNDRLSLWLLKPLVLAIAPFLRTSHLDRVVYVNNWLFSTNPCPRLTSSQVREVTAYLIESYPDYAIVFRSINKDIRRDFFDVLKNNKYKMLASRKVYIIDPSSKSYLKNENVRRDRNLLENSGYEIIGSSGFNEADISRITKLYRDLYLKKHSMLNPQFNEKFFSLALKKDIFTFKALKKNRQVDAFVAYFSENGVMTGSLLGYDIDLPPKLGLYRQAFAVLMSEASNRGQLLNLSAGAGLFKVFRGAQPCIEYDAIYDYHLPYYRRLAWYCLLAGGIFQRFNLSSAARQRTSN